MDNQKQAFKIPNHLTQPPYRLLYKDWQIYYSQLLAEDLALSTL